MLIARDPERVALLAALDGADSASASILIHGPAGIGKTTLLEWATEAAARRGFEVVSARPTEAESQLAFAALADLVRDADLGRLPDAERRALEVALGRRTVVGTPPQTHELGFAVVDLLAQRVDRGARVAVMVDDVQWIDIATRDVLTFAARRLPRRGVCLLIGQRTSSHGVRTDLLAVPEATVLGLGPLDAPAIAAVIDRALDTPLPSRVVEEVASVAAGNPFFAIEVARSLRAETPRPGRPLALPPSLDAVTAERIRALPRPTQEALAATAMLAHPDTATLDALGLLTALVPAETAEVVSVTGRRIEFTHPLLAAAAQDGLSGVERIGMRRRLAEVTTGTARCIHLALAATAPDPVIAAELATAAATELERGGVAEAAELATLALEATPPDDPERWQRRLLAAGMLFRAGHTDTAIAEASGLIAEPPNPLARTRALVLLATIEYSRAVDNEIPAGLAREALASTDDPALLAEAHTLLARVLYDDFDAAARHAEQALTLIRQTGTDDRLALSSAIQASATARFLSGHGLDRAAFDEAIELEQGSSISAADSAYGGLAALLKYADQLDESQGMLEALADRADAASLPYALSHLPQLHLWAGRWDAAEACAQRHLWLAEHTFQESQVSQARFNLATVAAYRGDLAAAERLGRQIYDEGRSERDAWTERNGASLLGLVAISSGEAAAAAEYFGRVDELGEAMNLRDPGYSRVVGDYVEALVAIGDTDRATEVVDRIAARAERLGRPSAISATRRGRALLAAAAGDRIEALANARQAVATVAGTVLVYEHSRALLTLGVVARRLKERGVAREALTAALAEFERMGASSLAARARHELDRVGRRAEGVTGLTPGEASVAELAARGVTTRQIADALFISTKTVEANLTRIYRKLGITNRAQLANAITPRAGRTEP